MEVTSWEELKKTREALFEVEPGRMIKLRGITERERLKATQESTVEAFDKNKKKYESNLNLDELGYRLILAGWVEPEIPGEDFTAKMDALKDLGFALLQKIAEEVNRLSGLSREDIERVKNFLGPA